MHSGGLVLQVEALGEPHQIALHRPIERVARRARDQAGQGGHIDDPSEPPLRHAGQHPVDQLRRRGEHHLDDRGLVRPAGLGIDPGQAIAGIVHQGVHLPAMGGEVIEDRHGRPGLGQVGGDGQGLDPVAQADLVGQALQPIGAPRGQGHIIAVAGEDPGRRRADPGRGPRHQRQSTIHRGPSVRARR